MTLAALGVAGVGVVSAQQAFSHQSSDKTGARGVGDVVGVEMVAASAGNESGGGEEDPAAVRVPEGMQEEVKYRYELRIRQMSAPEKVFEYFASVKDGEGNQLMTPVDFMLAITPVATQDRSVASLTAEAIALFSEFDINSDGLISFAEYIFFVTLLSIPENQFEIAFKMFDTNHDGTVDADEFSTVMEMMKNKTAVGQHARGGARSFTDARSGNEFADTCRGIKAFFGDDGSGSVSFENFVAYMKRLRTSIMHIEFDYYDINKSGTIPATAFALSVIGYAKTKDVSGYLGRIHTLPDEIKNVQFTFEEFKAFNRFLQSIDDVALAITLYGDAAGGSITAADFAHAARAVAGVELHPTQIALMIHLFDHDADGSLDPEELAVILAERANRGLTRPRTIGLFEKLACCKKCLLN